MMAGLLLALALTVVSASDEKEKAIRLKTTRQLKEILKELKIKYPADADKDKLRSLALKHDAITKYEELHPETKRSKESRASRGGAGDGMGGMGKGSTSMGGMA